MSERVSFNLNDYVFVRLTPYGRTTYRLWRQGNHYPYSEVEVTGDELRFQAWELMQIFGPTMSMARNPPFERLAIEMQTKDLTPVKP